MRPRLFHRALALLLFGLLALGLVASPIWAGGAPWSAGGGTRLPLKQRREAARAAGAVPAADRVAIQPGPPLPELHASHTATPLADGRILLVGGSSAPNDHLADVAIFDPETGALTAGSPLDTMRHDHTATLLPDGRVLVVGGYNAAEQWLDDAVIYDPTANAWGDVPPLYPHGTAHTATLLADGRVLVVGGCIGSGVCTERAEIFNPQTNRWAAAAALAVDRYGHAALLLADRRVLVIGGWSAQGAPADGPALIYDPRADRWAPTGPMQAPTLAGEALRLPDGRVLVAGGIAWPLVNPITISAAAEIYDPATNTWAAAAPMATPRYAFQLQLLPDGQALAIGGARDDVCCWSEDSFVGAIERFDRETGRWAPAGSLPTPTAFAAAAPLPDGRIWLTGGRNYGGFRANTWLIHAHGIYLPALAGGRGGGGANRTPER